MISIIVPAYNGENTVEKTIRSILAQTYTNIEVIAVNDGSTDGTKAVLEKIAKQDERVKIVNKENGGVSSARNAGLKAAIGEYITFVDADDFVEADMYELLFGLMNEHNADIAHCGYKRIEDGQEVFATNSGKVTVQSHGEALACAIEGKLFTGGVWNKLYKKSLFDNICFDETVKINEDILVNYLAFKNADRSVYTDSPKYIYNMRADSATHTVKKIKNALDCEKVARLICLNEEKSTHFDSAQRHLFDSLKAKYIVYHHSDEKNKKQVCKETANEMYEIIKSGVISSKKDKLICFIEKFLPFLFPVVYFVYDKIRKPNIDVG